MTGQKSEMPPLPESPPSADGLPEIPAMPERAPDVVAVPEAEAEATPEPGPALAPRPERRKLRAVLRWTAAVLVFGSLGTGVAYGITDQTRTDVPGLSTRNDGRWVYPKLTMPVLPAGARLPFDKDNPGGIHYASLSALLLPAPAGSKPLPELKGDKNRVSPDRFLAEYPEEERSGMKQDLTDGGLLDIAARGWTMPDSTSTRIYLVRFRSAGFANEFVDNHLGGALEATLPVNGVEDSPPLDESYPAHTTVPSTERDVYDEAAPRGPLHVRHAYIRSGDTVALIIQSKKVKAPAVPFHQAVVLQNQLLG
ncbi:hypothetical protein [Streptomyces lunaelactis]|uniref:hypothetical protein n=1 Tax=Streptomyces lunaelactis TaxID=1535768 RepID=UPI0028150F7C|nr:hypothetical protein [Streptomyces lunaelactis]